MSDKCIECGVVLPEKGKYYSFRGNGPFCPTCFCFWHDVDDQIAIEDGEFPFVKVIAEPLTTEDGNINPVCVQQLFDAINNLPRPHEDNSKDEEWTTRRWTSIKDITATLACWAIRLSPFACPDDLNVVIQYLHACLKQMLKPDENEAAELSLNDISKLLYKILYDEEFKPFTHWNKRKRLPTEEECESPSSQRPPETGFISLDVLIRNVCVEIRDCRRKFDQFEKDFNVRHGK